MQSIQFLAIFFITILLTVSAAPQQTYRTYRSLLRDGTFDHASMFRFTSDGAAASGQKLPRDYPLQYGASSPLYVFDGRLYNLASARS
ncbi:uncharacterized protein CELE_F02E11.2 [Caenorhabditis elegans]|uniref:Secreted protein n=1 Tax=Caenorhabditis elegans TaxID=6239 RepID=O16571_CAEEL|nr:Secreted protein [Caenorhabditis elegans]CCD64924.1 Secreted protein [Caenorhabditis elegans]|eukprot:NP_001254066.1 Uncharacterized protein CELE_F02E11.2 [Caenorhabditis elegans]